MYHRMVEKKVRYGENALFRKKFRKPESIEQLVKALHCILTFLKDYHKTNFMHRDIQWTTIMKEGVSDKWRVTNYDHACESPASSPYSKLDRETHAPEIFSLNGSHNQAVDIWSIGHLIQTATSEQKLIEYSKILMNPDPDKRPNAKVACHWLWCEYRSCLMNDFSREDSMEDIV
ncbi:crinkler (CRN) family protein [Rhizophagus clarus]|nr:crinkler (CRN) family protein [Rhizophagus clarus]